MSITVTQGHLIRANKTAGVSPADTARRFGLPLTVVKWVYEGNEPKGGFTTPAVRDRDFEEMGRADLRKFLVDKKEPDQLWARSTALDRARAQYDAGLIDMAQGRSSKFIFLYAFPRQVKDTRRQPYFGGQPVHISPEQE